MSLTAELWNGGIVVLAYVVLPLTAAAVILFYRPQPKHRQVCGEVRGLSTGAPQ